MKGISNYGNWHHLSYWILKLILVSSSTESKWYHYEGFVCVAASKTTHLELNHSKHASQANPRKWNHLVIAGKHVPSPLMCVNISSAILQRIAPFDNAFADSTEVDGLRYSLKTNKNY